MTEVAGTAREIEALRDRLSKISEVNLRINESLDYDTVMHEVLESARLLTEARYGVLVTFDELKRVEDFLSAGLSEEESRWLQEMPAGQRFCDSFSGIQVPVRIPDFHSYLRAQGLPAFHSSEGVLAFLVAPIRHRGEGLGYILLAKRGPGREFAHADEETLVTFASQAALVIANAHRYRDERRARADLEALINTSPVGVFVFNAVTGVPLSMNRESRRIVGDLCGPGLPAERLLDSVTLQRADGSETSLAGFPQTPALRTGEAARAEEIVLRGPDGWQVVAMVNATPLYTADGGIESVVLTLQDMTPVEELARLRTEFLGMVSHELNAPLAAIFGAVVAMVNGLSEFDAAEILRFCRVIEEEAGHMRDLIGDLLDVVHIETGTLAVTPGPQAFVLFIFCPLSSTLRTSV